MSGASYTDTRVFMDVLERLSVVEVSVQCHEANAVHQIQALTATREIDDKHNTNVARLEHRIGQLDALNHSLADQVVGYRRHNESLEQRIKSLENQNQQSATLIQSLFAMISGVRGTLSPPANLPPPGSNCVASANSSPASSLPDFHRRASRRDRRSRRSPPILRHCQRLQPQPF